MGRKSINQLKADHQRILQALDVLRDMTQQLETNGTLTREDVLDLLEFLQGFAHEYHDAKEQRLLLPAVAPPPGAAATAAFERIESDHSRMHTLMDGLREALIEHKDAEFIELATTYIELLTTHIFTEDRFLFAAMEKTLTPEGDEQLFQAFDRFEPQLRDYNRDRFEKVVPRLARKYCTPQCV